ncbi:DNA cytosine methyltransferase [Phenylobacterium sp.]|uniref:DNA cytosine methyltransferase n=1 Tax=Phenylobacterium sp. TaxID=1871053 RepID=UPI003BAB8D30
MSRPSRTFYEFFAGGGMARLGLGDGWFCGFANDFDATKAAAYRANFADADAHFRQGDVWALSADDLPGRADLAWASSPCQDFSLAGGRAGLKGGRSSAFFGFWRLMEALDDAGRAPRLIVVENVVGLLTSHGGADFTALGAALSARGYRFGALEIDAATVLPQSRPRVFVIAARDAPAGLTGDSPFHTRAVKAAHAGLPPELAQHWVWWRLAAPPARNTHLAAVLEPDDAVAWHTPAQTARLLDLMGPLHRARVETRSGRAVGAVFRRSRLEGGRTVQRAEVRFDGLAGCLRTPRGGSSRQSIVIVENGRVRSRLVSPREAARLMGLPDSYVLPKTTTGALQVAGDGVAVPVVRWLAQELLEPLLGGRAPSLDGEGQLTVRRAG